jgi:hypothetical protein
VPHRSRRASNRNRYWPPLSCGAPLKLLLLLLLLHATPATAAAAASGDTTHVAQEVDYRIEARLDEAAQRLNGRLRLHYRNHAAARLDTMWFHLHLNAFRPHSAWAQRELQFGERRFQDLAPADHAYERVHRVRVDGIEVEAVFPGAPDSTVMGIPLPIALERGASATVEMDWEARPSTLPRRQGRRGRHYDFAQWYPRVAAYDRGGWQVQPLLPQGEFYGEFASYDVSLDIAADQVIGATGVPVEGDPGWHGAAAAPCAMPLYRRDAYAQTAAVPLGLIDAEAAEGRRIVRWRAEDVHHFAWSTSPDYIYEGGAYGDVAVHVLYRPDDTDWADGVVVQRTIYALAFYDTIFGPYPWPQITNLHRIEGGATEFPMLVMNGSPSVGLILHEVGHSYVHGILANNEWREGWLDEGFVSFLTNWAHELAGRPVNWDVDLATIRAMEQRRLSQPIGLASAEFRDPQTYGAMTYTKPALVFRMLHWLMGDEAFRAGLRDYYSANMLQHVSEAELRVAMGAHYPGGLDWFFDQWIHTTATLDYRLGELTAVQEPDGSWTARVEVIRDGDIWMPVDLRVNDITQRLSFRERRQVVTVSTAVRPFEAVIDPGHILIDVNPFNNRRRFPE